MLLLKNLLEDELRKVMDGLLGIKENILLFLKVL
jgi:hypothetical protein